MKLSKGNIIVIGIIGVIAVLYFGYDYLEMRNAEQFLRQRFGKEFVATHCEYYLSGPGLHLNIRTGIMSKDEPPVKFDVGRRLGSDRNNFGGWGRYLNKILGREVDDKLLKIVEQMGYPLFFSAVSGGPFYNQLHGTTPSFFEAIKTQPDIINSRHFGLTIHLLAFNDLNESNKPQEMERIMQFMHELQKIGIPSCYELIITYYLPEYLPEARKNIDLVGGTWELYRIDTSADPAHPVGFSRSKDRLRNEFTLTRKNAENIKTPNDLMPYFSARR